MTRYIVFERPEPSSGDAVFLRDRFYVVAFLLPFVWFAAHRLYLAAAISLVVQSALALLGSVPGFGLTSLALILLCGTGVALEGPRLVAARLRRKGYKEAAVVYAGAVEDAELLHFGLEARTDPVDIAAVEQRQQPIRSRTVLPVLGWRSARTLLDVRGR